MRVFCTRFAMRSTNLIYYSPVFRVALTVGWMYNHWGSGAKRRPNGTLFVGTSTTYIGIQSLVVPTEVKSEEISGELRFTD